MDQSFEDTMDNSNIDEENYDENDGEYYNEDTNEEPLDNQDEEEYENNLEDTYDENNDENGGYTFDQDELQGIDNENYVDEDENNDQFDDNISNDNEYPNYPLGNEENEYEANDSVNFNESGNYDELNNSGVYTENSLNDSGNIDINNVRESLDTQELDSERHEKAPLSEEEILRQRYLKVYKLAWERNLQLNQQKLIAEDSLETYFKMTKKQENKDKLLSSNAEDRYKKLIETHSSKRIELSKSKAKNNAQLRELLIKVQNKQSAAGKLQTSYLQYKMGSAAQAENSRTGKPIPQNRIDELTQLHIKKDEEVRIIRTKNIYLTNQKDALEKSIKQKEFSDGLHLIDFEQFKMENATLNEKIEEKNESLQKSTLKARSTVHILTHVNEKLQFVQTEDIEMKQRLADLEKQLSVNKKLLAGLKDTRDYYKDQNIRMRDANPLIGNDQLLLDYESRKQELEDLRYKLKHLRNLHSENERKTNGTRMKIKNQLEKIESGNQSRLFPNIHPQRI